MAARPCYLVQTPSPSPLHLPFTRPPRHRPPRARGPSGHIIHTKPILSYLTAYGASTGRRVGDGGDEGGETDAGAGTGVRVSCGVSPSWPREAYASPILVRCERMIASPTGEGG